MKLGRPRDAPFPDALAQMQGSEARLLEDSV